MATRTAIFPITGGDVTLIFPETMTKADLDDLGEYLALFLTQRKPSPAPSPQIARTEAGVSEGEG